MRAYLKTSVPRSPLTSIVKSHGLRTAVRAISKTPRAPDSNRASADDASSTVTERPDRSRTNVSDWPLTSTIGPAIQVAMSSRWLPRSAIVVPPIDRSKRQSNGIVASTNSSDSHVPRTSLTPPTAPSSIIRFISATAGSRR